MPERWEPKPRQREGKEPKRGATSGVTPGTERLRSATSRVDLNPQSITPNTSSIVNMGIFDDIKKFFSGEDPTQRQMRHYAEEQADAISQQEEQDHERIEWVKAIHDLEQSGPERLRDVTANWSLWVTDNVRYFDLLNGTNNHRIKQELIKDMERMASDDPAVEIVKALAQLSDNALKNTLKAIEANELKSDRAGEMRKADPRFYKERLRNMDYEDYQKEEQRSSSSRSSAHQSDKELTKEQQNDAKLRDEVNKAIKWWRERGDTPEEIAGWIRADGLDPKDFGY